MRETIEKPYKRLARASIGSLSKEMRNGWLCSVLVLLAALLFMFYPILFGGKTTVVSAAHCRSIMPGGAFGGDHFYESNRQISPDPWAAASQNEAWIKFLGDTIFREQKIPLWNAYSGCGMPFLANSISQALCPPNIIASLFACNLSVDLMVLSRLLLAGVLSYFALRLFVPGLAALVGAVSYMFTGYFLLYLNMPDIFVELLIPGLILATEFVIRKPGCLSTAICAGIVALDLFGGLPEVSFLSLVFMGWYVLARLLTLKGWMLRLRMFGLISLAYFAGLALASPQVLPLLEYLRYSDNAHDPAVCGALCGLDYDTDWRRGLLSYLFPMGWQHKYFARGFYGVGLTYLAEIGIFVTLRNMSGLRRTQTTNVVMSFFLVAFVFMLLKRFGSPLAQWVGLLPLFKMVLFTKYDEPLMAICIAALCALGAYSIQQGSIGARVLVGSACLLWLTATIINFMPCVPALSNLDSPANMRNSMLIGLVVLIACTSLGLLSFISARVRRALPLLILIPLLFETYTGYFSQAFYGKEGFVSRNFEPYAGAPYIEFLRSRITAHERVFGLAGVLVPNWSAAFGIQDVRYVDALCPAKFHDLIEHLLSNPSRPFRGRGFDGVEISTGDQVALRRLCALTSTKYLLSPNSIEEYNDLIVATAHKFDSHSSPEGLRFVPLATIDGVKQPIMFQHPNQDPSFNALKVPLDVPDVDAVLEVDFVRNPDRFCPARDTPIEAVISVQSRDASQPPAEFVFSNADARMLHATRYKVDLQRFSGKKVILSLTSRTSAENQCAWEWVGWKKLSFRETNKLPCVYSREIKIYQLPEPLPRASVFSSAEVFDSDNELLNRLSTASFSPLTKVLFTRSDLSVAAAEQINRLTQAPPCRPARIVKYDSDRLEIEVDPIASSTVLLLTDNYYPGWRALVDGKEIEILRANLCFRALLLPAGAKTVLFQYDPISFKFGLCLSGFTVLCFLAAGGFRLWRNRITTPSRSMRQK